MRSNRVEKFLAGIIILILCLGVTFIPARATTPTGLVGDWKFSEGSGTTAADSIGGNTATLVGGATWTTGKVNPYALNIPTPGGAANAHAVAPANSNPNPNLTYPNNTLWTTSFWYKEVSPTGHAFSTLSNGVFGHGWFFYDAQGTNVTCNVFTNNGSATAVLFTGSLDTRWHMLTCAYDGINLYAYFDGLRVDTKPLTGTISANTDIDVNGVAHMYWSGPNIGNGGVAGYYGETSIYNTALTADQINQIFLEVIPRYSVNISASGTGTGTLSCVLNGGSSQPCSSISQINDSDSLVITATATTGSAFGSWSWTSGTTCPSSATACTISSASGNITGQVTFNLLPTYAVSISPDTSNPLYTGSGTFTCIWNGGRKEIVQPLSL